MISSSSAVAAPQFAARERMHGARISRALQNYPMKHRSAVMHAASDDMRLADLALSFPAILFVIAVPHKSIDQLALANAVKVGASLKFIAQHFGLPFWLRKLPPQAFEEPLGKLPQGPFISRQIGNHLPLKMRHAARWLKSVSLAARAGNEPFALWIAALSPDERERLSWRDLDTLGLWAWSSAQKDGQLGRLCRKPWHMKMKLKQAVDACRNWVEAVNTHLLLQVRRQPAAFAPATLEGIEFVHLATAEMIAEEADRMRHCILSYGQDIAYYATELWSMRKEGVSIATLSVAPSYRDGLADITEIKGSDNKKVGKDVALVARRWAQSHDVSSIDLVCTEAQRDDCRKAWIALFKPYWIEKRRISEWPKLHPHEFRLFAPYLRKRKRVV